MFRNVESKFASVPQIDIERSTFERPSELKTSFNFGDLIPIYAEEVLPGDTVKMTTSKVVRLQTMITPVLDNAMLDVFWFFCSNRLVWNNWKRFMGEQVYPDGAWVQSTKYTVPTISSPTSSGTPIPFAKGSLADYFGLPLGVSWSASAKNAPMALPFRMYALIANEFFRDQNVSAPLSITMTDSNHTGSNGSNYITDVENGGMPFKVAKIHDMFTSCLPSPQRAPNAVTFPLISGKDAPVYTKDVKVPYPGSSINSLVIPTSSATYTSAANWNDSTMAGWNRVNVSSSDVQTGSATTFSNAVTSASSGFKPVNLWADLSTSVGAVSINAIRLAFSLQRYYERAARAGSRYTETIRNFFGVVSPDSRLQRPEYLGGSRIPININEIVNSAQSSGEPLGDVGAKSQTTDVNFDFEHSFTEHGWLIGLMCARTDRTYTQGLDKKWLRKEQFDYYFPPFAHIGEMPIPKVCIYAGTDAGSDSLMNSDEVFGYNEAWIEYRAKNNKATGEMRTSSTGVGLGDVWTFADYYSSKPYLNDAWIREPYENVDRTLAVQKATSDQLFCDIFFDSVWTRPMPLYSVPGLIDHF